MFHISLNNVCMLLSVKIHSVKYSLSKWPKWQSNGKKKEVPLNPTKAWVLHLFIRKKRFPMTFGQQRINLWAYSPRGIIPQLWSVISCEHWWQQNYSFFFHGIKGIYAESFRSNKILALLIRFASHTFPYAELWK